MAHLKNPVAKVSPPRRWWQLSWYSRLLSVVVVPLLVGAVIIIKADKQSNSCAGGDATQQDLCTIVAAVVGYDKGHDGKLPSDLSVLNLKLNNSLANYDYDREAENYQDPPGSSPKSQFGISADFSKAGGKPSSTQTYTNSTATYANHLDGRTHYNGIIQNGTVNITIWMGYGGQGAADDPSVGN